MAGSDRGLMRLAEHENERPQPPDLYIRGRAGRSSADLSAQPESYHDRQIGQKKPVVAKAIAQRIAVDAI